VSIVQAFEVIGVSAAPVAELRGGIPLALAMGLSPAAALVLAIAGNFLPVPGLLILFRWAIGLSGRSEGRLGSWARAYLRWQRARYSRRFSRWGDLALVLLVAIPLPATGAWTGCLVASLMGVPLSRAIPLIGAGVVIAGGVVLAASLGAFSLL
jgi:uncharacterized membrane protein